MIPYQSAADKVTAPELSMSSGEEVEVIVTTGAQKKPYPNLEVYLLREYEFSWREGGETHNGLGGPRWSATTDASGRVTVHTLPGKLRASAYTPQWRTEETVDVGSGQRTQIQLHRKIETKRKLTGRLTLAAGLSSDLAEAEIQICAVDGHSNEKQTLKSGNDGSFSFESLAEEIAVFASTRDGQAAGWKILKYPDTAIELQLRATQDYQGQLLGKGDQPLANHGVRASVRIEVERKRNAMNIFDVKHFDTRTDNQGNFTFHGVPCEMKMQILADSIDGSQGDTYVGEVSLKANQPGSRVVSRLGQTSRRGGNASGADSQPLLSAAARRWVLIATVAAMAVLGCVFLKRRSAKRRAAR
jgi:hypothetical protein